MRANKTAPWMRQLILFFAPNSLQTRFQYNKQDSAFMECSCSPQTILAKSRGQYVPLCSDMPWACPLRPIKKTPSV